MAAIAAAAAAAAPSVTAFGSKSTLFGFDGWENAGSPVVGGFRLLEAPRM